MTPTTTTREHRWSPTELRDAARTGALIGMWGGAATVATLQVVGYAKLGWLGVDAHAYWTAFRSPSPYAAAPRYVDAYEYSPLFVQSGRPLGLLPFPVFFALWAGVELLAFVVLTRGLAWRWRGPILLLCASELAVGNIVGLLDLVLAFGARVPGLWAFPLLTKVTPAGPGMLWLAARGSWRALVRLLGCTAVLTAVSAIAQPQLWHDWFAYLHCNAHSDLTGLVVRCGLAALITLVAARSSRPWLLPLAAVVCTPVTGGLAKDAAYLPAALYLYRQGRDGTRVDRAESTRRAMA